MVSTPANPDGLYETRTRKDQITTNSHIAYIERNCGVKNVLDLFPEPLEPLKPLRAMPNDVPMLETNAQNLPMALLEKLGNFSAQYPKDMEEAMSHILVHARERAGTDGNYHSKPEDVEEVMDFWGRQDEKERVRQAQAIQELKDEEA